MTDEFLEFKHKSGITISIPRGLKKEERDQALASANMMVSILLHSHDLKEEEDNKPLAVTAPYDDRLSDKRKQAWTEKRRRAWSKRMLKVFAERRKRQLQNR